MPDIAGENLTLIGLASGVFEVVTFLKAMSGYFGMVVAATERAYFFF